MNVIYSLLCVNNGETLLWWWNHYHPVLSVSPAANVWLIVADMLELIATSAFELLRLPSLTKIDDPVEPGDELDADFGLFEILKLFQRNASVPF